MKLRILSDIHLEFGYMDLRPGGDVLVLAGDVGVVAKPKYLDLVAEWATMFDRVIYVPGNHEYYKGSIDVAFDKLMQWSKGTNIHVLNNDAVIIDDIVFIGSTLWSDLGNPLTRLTADNRMNDFRGTIRYNNFAYKFKAADSYEEYSKSINYLSDYLRVTTTFKKPKIVIITHHAPSFKSVKECYKGDVLNDAFASNLEWMMKAYEPNLWIHGHMHNSSDYNVHKTRVICNPRGYVGYEFNEDFDKTLTVEI